MHGLCGWCIVLVWAGNAANTQPQQKENTVMNNRFKSRAQGLRRKAQRLHQQADAQLATGRTYNAASLREKAMRAEANADFLEEGDDADDADDVDLVPASHSELEELEDIGVNVRANSWM